MEEKKHGHGGVVFLVIILLIVFLIGGWCLGTYYTTGKISFTKEVKKKSVEKKSTKPNEEALDLTSSDVLDLENRFLGDNNNCFNSKVSSFLKDKSISVGAIDNTSALKVALDVYYPLYINDVRQSIPESISASEMEEKVKSLYGDSYEFTPTVNATAKLCIPYNYDEASRSYKKIETECGGTCIGTDLVKVTKAIKKDDGIDLYVRKLFIKSDDTAGKITYYNDYNLTSELVDFSYKMDDDNKIPTLDDKNFKDASFYKLIFKKDSKNNYYFSRAEVI